MLRLPSRGNRFYRRSPRPAASHPPREGDRDDPQRAAAAQGPGAGRERRPGGQHVVDEQRRCAGPAHGPRSAAACRAAPRGACRPGDRRRRGAGIRAAGRRPSAPARAAAISAAGSKPRSSERDGRGRHRHDLAPLQQAAGASRWMRSAISSATGSRRRNLSATTSSRATPSCGAEDQAAVDAGRPRAAQRPRLRQPARAGLAEARLAAAEPAAGQRRGAARGRCRARRAASCPEPRGSPRARWRAIGQESVRASRCGR